MLVSVPARAMRFALSVARGLAVALVLVTIAIIPAYLLRTEWMTSALEGLSRAGVLVAFLVGLVLVLLVKAAWRGVRGWLESGGPWEVPDEARSRGTAGAGGEWAASRRWVDAYWKETRRPSPGRTEPTRASAGVRPSASGSPSSLLGAVFTIVTVLVLLGAVTTIVVVTLSGPPELLRSFKRIVLLVALAGAALYCFVNRRKVSLGEAIGVFSGAGGAPELVETLMLD